MDNNDIAIIRLHNQQITAQKFTTPKQLVSWMGALQAQDYAMSKWAIGVRTPGSTEQEIENALNRGELIRTHLLRPTWHIVSAEDIYWLLALTAPRIINSMKTRNNELELSESILMKSIALISRALEKENHLTREELVAELKRANIATENNRASHIFFHAELEGIICNGLKKDKKLTYTLLSERVPKAKKLTREEALEKIAQKYFLSHGPASLKDFVWWAGLTVRDARDALDSIKSHLVSEEIESERYWFADSGSIPGMGHPFVYLLPAYDEFIISYKTKSAALSLLHHRKAVSVNGIFRPILVINGQIGGLWRRTIKKEKVLIEVNLFQEVSKVIKKSIEQRADEFGSFLNKEPEITYL